MTRGEKLTVLGGIGAVGPILLCGIRVLAVSGGEPNTLRALVQNLDVKALALATLLPFVATVAFWVQLLIFTACFTPKLTKRQRNAYIGFTLFLLPFTVALFVFGMSQGQVIGNSVVLGFCVILVILGVRHRGGVVAQMIMVLLILGWFGAAMTIILFATFNTKMWLPTERITIVGAAVVDECEVVDGYVLAVDQEWTRLMTVDKQLRTVSTKTVKTREFIDAA